MGKIIKLGKIDYLGIGKKIDLDFIYNYERLFQSLGFVQDAQYYIKKDEDIGVGYFNEYEFARDWLKELGVEL